MSSSDSGPDYWSDFPVTYRAEEVATIMRWVAAGESGVVAGGSGTGKSNLAGFLGSRPDAIAPHVRSDPDRYCLLHLDINRLPALTAPFFYRSLIQTLLDAVERWSEDLQSAVVGLSRNQINWEDTFALLSLLEEAHRLVVQKAGKKVIWLLDRFDEAYLRLDAQTVNSLRSLRDRFKGQVCYVVFSRHPLARLRNPTQVDEFHEILAANLCWVGPMVERDARWIARQMAGRLQTRFDESEVEQLLAASGRLPAFMKLACLALAEGAISPGQSSQTWVGRLLVRPEFQRNCQEIWNDLRPEEQNTLLALDTGADQSLLDAEVVAYLEGARLLVRRGSDSRLTLFSPIFSQFMTGQRGMATGRLELDAKTGELRRDGIPLNVELSVSEARLLAYFLDRAGEICEKDDLMGAVWPEEQYGVGDERLAQLVKRLRDKIERDTSHPVYIQTVRGRGYRLVQPDQS